MGGEMARVALLADKSGYAVDVGERLPVEVYHSEHLAQRACDKINAAHAARVRPLVEALETISIGTEDKHFPFRSIGNEQSKEIARKALVEFRNGK